MTTFSVIARSDSDVVISSNIQFFVYILTTKKNTALYTGMPNDLEKRVYEHKSGITVGFTRRYRVTKLVWFEIFDNPENAIEREKQIKSWSRKRKNDLINSQNLNWNDLMVFEIATTPNGVSQ